MNRNQSLLAWFCTKPPFFRFTLGFLVTIVLSMLWPLTLYIVCRRCDNQVAVFRSLLANEQTYTTAHHIFFAPAVGLFLASLSGELFAALRRRGKILLVLLLGCATWLSFEDIFYGPAGSHQLRNECEFITKEAALRARAQLQARANQPDPTLEKDITAFLDSKTTRGIRDSLGRINENGIASGILTWLFVMFIAVFVWYSTMYVAGRRFLAQRHFELVMVLVLMTPWLPLRIYTDWYVSGWHTVDTKDSPVTFGLITALLLVMFFLATAILTYIREDRRTMVGCILGAIISFVGLLFSVLPKFSPLLNRYLNQLTVAQMVVAVFLSVLLTFATANFAFSESE